VEASNSSHEPRRRSAPPTRARRAALQVLRFIQGRPRLLIGLTLGLGAALLLPATTPLATRVLTGWNVAVWSYLVLVGWLMARASAAGVRTLAEREDPSAAAVLLLMSITATASLAAIVLELGATRNLPFDERLLHYALTAITLAGYWLFLNTMFTLHYARLFYRSDERSRPLRFPEGERVDPNYWDFLYFAFTIATAAQTSDVSVTTRAMRRVVLGHSVLGFVFNAAIIGMSINVAAGLMSS
jgi:uncharacterized membrane protein